MGKMLVQGHLKLRLIHLRPLGEWLHGGAGLFFLFLKDGVGQYVVGRDIQRLARRDVLVSSPDREAKLVAAKRAGLSFFCFCLSWEHLLPLFAAEEIALLESVRAGLKRPRVYAASSAVAQRCAQWIRALPPENDLNYRGELLSLAVSLLTEEFKKARTQRAGFAKAEGPLNVGLCNLSAEELLDCSVEELAAKFDCGRRQLNRLFHQHFGYSVAALRMELRMLKAVTLLRDPDAKVVNVAEQCGFHHIGLFNTCFKKRFGASPTEWRNLDSPLPSLPSEQCSENRLCPIRLTNLWTAGEKPQTAKR